MIIIGNIQHRLIILCAAIVIITLIGYLDYLTGRELSFSIFYLMPIAVYALYRGTNILQISIISGYAAVIWFLVEVYTREYSHIFYPIWNAFVRLLIFETMGLLFFYLKDKGKKLREVSQMSNITLEVLKQLLDVSKIESGKFDFKVTTLDYIHFIKQYILINQMLARRKNIDIDFITETEAVNADFDSHLLGEVINNLLSNAIKYSYENSVITVKTTVLPGKILTEVIDNGKGIAEEEQQNLFNYFHTTSTLPTGGEQSTGLGLAIVKRIITLHNGEAGVTSTLNKGSKIYFTLPINYTG